MSLSLEEVEHIAHLARLSLNEAEKSRYQAQLSKILDYIARLQDLDTSRLTEEMSAHLSAGPSRGALREDNPMPGLTPQVLLGIAPQVEDGQYRVPAVFDHNAEES